MKRLAAVCAGILIAMTTITPVPVHAAEKPGAVLISELQTGGCAEATQGATCQEEGTQEFVELHNPSELEDLDVTGWRIEYLSASKPGDAPPTRTLIELEGKLVAGGYALFSYAGYLQNADGYFGHDSTAASGLIAKTGGSIRVTNTEGSIIDLVSWGSAGQFGDFYRAPQITPGHSIQRFLPGHPQYDGTALFSAPTTPSAPQHGGLQQANQDTKTPEAPDPKDDAGAHTGTCAGVVLSELLPNPASYDTNKEFIEIYNPTDQPIQLRGCSLRLGETGVPFALPDELLEPGAYRSFSDNQTGIVLPNAAGATVWLLSVSEEVGLQYPGGLESDQAWALVGGGWQKTIKPTPGAANIRATPALLPCGEGKERNPETNRCRSVTEAPSGLTPCKQGQYRNPATNRCKSVAQTVSFTPCKPGQQRNPETNRCRSIVQAASQLKPCEPGYTRNPATNRCRKEAGAVASNVAQIKDVQVPTTDVLGWWVAGVGVAGATGYGIYEWRHSIWRTARRFFGRDKT